MAPRWGKRLVVAILWATFCLVTAFLSTPQSIAESNQSTWFTKDVGLDVLAELDSPAQKPYSINGNRPCSERKVVTLPEAIIPIWPYLQTEQAHDSCVVNTGYGGWSQSGYLQVQGANVFGELRSASGARLNLIAAPTTSTAIYTSPAANTGVYIFFVKDFGANIASQAVYSGEVTHKLKPDAVSTTLKDKSGELLSVDYDSISFSSNGQWMIASIPYVGVARIDMDTYEVLPFGDSFNYNIGLSPAAQTAVTNDGRFAVVASTTFGRFKLYDLATCTAAPTRLTGPVSCQSRDLWPVMQEKIPSFYGLSTIRFVGNDSLSLYAASRDAGGIAQMKQYYLYAGSRPQSELQYLALGDSFAAGEGAYDYNSLTDTSINKCHLSLRSYPYLIARAIGLNQQQSIACSGAKIDDITKERDEYKGQVTDNIFQIKRDSGTILSGYLPGYLNQIKFVRPTKPETITISVVGNDIGFADKIKRCLMPDTCYSTYEDRREVLNEINNQFYRLTEAYTKLKEASGPYTRIYAIGYPQLAYPEGSCGVNVHLNRTELVFANQLVEFLNNMIEQAARNTGVTYVDVEQALAGHRICETVYSDLAVNGLTAGKDKIDFMFIRGPIGNESYHPNALGQRLLQQAIIEKTNGLTLPMSAPDKTAGPPVISDSLGILQAPKVNRSLFRPVSQPMAKPVVYKNVAESVVVEAAFEPNSQVTLELRSEPFNLGSFTIDASGSLRTSITIPGVVSAGYHTLHAYGKNSSGEAIDVYQVVYVAASENDINGNGVTDDQDPCIVVPAANIDTDKDGLDDACDPLIEEPPIVVMPPDPTPLIDPPDDKQNGSNENGNPQASESDKLLPQRESNPWGSYSPLAASQLETIAASPQPAVAALTRTSTPSPNLVATTSEAAAADNPEVLAVETPVGMNRLAVEEMTKDTPKNKEFSDVLNKFVVGGFLLILLAIVVSVRLTVSKRPY